MELSKESVKAFIKAYEQDTGEELAYIEAHEIAHRLVNVFLILGKAGQRPRDNEELTKSENL